ncbi:MAG: hypothetical protein D6811_05145, partial [Alphaproteobacteria bacterium]
MTILALADWFDQLRVTRVTWSLPASGDVVEVQGGTVQIVTRTTRQWEAELQFSVAAVEDARATEALLDIVGAPDTAVEVKPAPWSAPAYDPTGSLITGYSPTVSAIGTDGQSITLSGMPAGYVLAPGDFIGVSDADVTGDRMNRLYRCRSTATADGTGTIGPITVSPLIDTMVEVGQPVTIKNPVMIGMALPSSLQRGSARKSSVEGATLVIRQ